MIGRHRLAVILSAVLLLPLTASPSIADSTWTGTISSFTAFVSADAPSDSFPVAASASASVTVTHAGWPGTVSSFTATPSYVDADHPSSSVAFWLTDSIIPTPYVVTIYDHHGNLVKRCGYPATTRCLFTSRPGAGTARIYYAYVALDAPAVGPPNGVVASAGPVVVSAIPEDELLESDLVQSLVASMGTKYVQEEACLRLGEAVRTNALRSSVPDATLVCNASGMQKALQLIANTAGAMGALAAVMRLVDADTGPEPPSYSPDCDHVGADGACRDQGSPAFEPLPEPEPAGGGVGILPPDGCPDAASRAWSRTACPSSTTTWPPSTAPGARPSRQSQIATLSVNDSARSWNVRTMLHRGPHPAEYHQWVLDNMRAADRAANGDVNTFLALFDQWVTQKVLDDPTIVRVA